MKKFTIEYSGFDGVAGFIPAAVKAESVDAFLKGSLPDNSHWAEKFVVYESVDGCLSRVYEGFVKQENLRIFGDE